MARCTAYIPRLCSAAYKRAEKKKNRKKLFPHTMARVRHRYITNADICSYTYRNIILYIYSIYKKKTILLSLYFASSSLVYLYFYIVYYNIIYMVVYIRPKFIPRSRLPYTNYYIFTVTVILVRGR